MKKILIIEDDKLLLEELKNLYLGQSFLVSTLNEFTLDIDNNYFNDFDLVVLDINLPKYSGYEILSKIKESSLVPVLILTSRNTLDDELMSFDLGADEFINKPVSPARLIARSKKLLNIYERFQDEIRLKDLILQTSTNKLSYKDSFIILADNEADLLAKLMESFPNTVDKDDLLIAAWHTSYIDENILHVNINRLRKKLGVLGLDNIIINVRSKGYRIDMGEIWNTVLSKIQNNT